MVQDALMNYIPGKFKTVDGQTAVLSVVATLPIGPAVSIGLDVHNDYIPHFPGVGGLKRFAKQVVTRPFPIPKGLRPKAQRLRVRRANRMKEQTLKEFRP
jgi:hypothetical protein